MYLHEAQAKALLGGYGIAVPEGRIATSAAEAAEHMTALGAPRCAIKALIHAGGRGLAGGVRFADTPEEAASIAQDMLGSILVTHQTRSKGERIDEVYIERALAFDTALYLSLIVDQRRATPCLLASPDGGVDFEAKAQSAPQMVHKYPFGIDGGHNPAALTAFLANLGVDDAHCAAVREVIEGMVRAFLECDASLIEINPLALKPGGRAVAVDAKMILDGNALFRHPEFEKYRDTARVDETEMVAQQNEINFVKMDGDIGLVVNGAGLGLATHDMVIEAGGKPANFMDIRTMATASQISKGIGILFDDPGVRVVLVNVHGGGMTTCDRISEAIRIAAETADRTVPVIFRVAGQNAEDAREMMRALPLSVTIAPTMADAVRTAVGRA